jgi:ABC-2 type transport system ATP-binding protein
MSIEVQNVSKYYGSQAALKNVSFKLKKGEVVGFLGPNGAGKSTMMKIITCYLPPSEGIVNVAGLSIDDKALEIRKKVGYLPETNPLYPEMYIREYLEFAAGFYRIANKKSRVEEMIELVGLGLESHKRIGELSKGYRQRVGLAQALIHDPEVLILDEPTSGLDPNQLEDIRKLIRKIGKEKTVLLSTHIMQEVEAVCNRVIIIKLGEIVADDSVDVLKSTKRTDVVYIKFSNAIDKSKLKRINGVTDIKSSGANGYKVFVETGLSIAKEINDLANSENTIVEELRREERSLEDIFKSLTK